MLAELRARVVDVALRELVRHAGLDLEAQHVLAIAQRAAVEERVLVNIVHLERDTLVGAAIKAHRAHDERGAAARIAGRRER